MLPGDKVEWSNGWSMNEVVSRGEIVFVDGDWAVVRSPMVAEKHPHICPYITKRTWELRLVIAPDDMGEAA